MTELPPPNTVTRNEVAPQMGLAASMLGTVAIEEALTGQQVEEEFKSREQQLFAPLPDLESSDTGEELDFSFLFADDETFEAHFKQAEIDRLNPDTKGENMKKRATVTRESVDVAKIELMSARYKDAEIDSIISEHTSGKNIIGDELLLALRTDKDLRLKVGMRLLDVVNDYPYPIRSGANQKRTDAPGYEDMPSNMTSSEYVAVLMLSMLDGTFKENNSDPIVKGEFGEVKIGFHRNAAKTILQRLGSSNEPLLQV